MTENNENKGIVQFFNNQGIHLRTLKIPVNERVNSIAWEGNGLRLSMILGSSIYFANIKPNYKWGYLSTGTLIFAYQKSDRIEYSVIFWDTKTEAKNFKYIKNLSVIKAFGEFCVLITKIEENSDQYQLLLCNSIGSPVDSKFINIEPLYVTMSSTHIIVCSDEHIYVWQYKNAVSRLTTFESVKQGNKINKKNIKKNTFLTRAFFLKQNHKTIRKKIRKFKFTMFCLF